MRIIVNDCCFCRSVQTIRENPFTTERRSGGDSPVSIGESLDKTNPFKSEGNELTALKEQLKTETKARLESQVTTTHSFYSY